MNGNGNSGRRGLPSRGSVIRTVLLVDNSPFVAEALALRLGLFLKDCRILTAADGMAAVEILKSNAVDFIMTDLQMPVMDGYELIAYCKKNHPRIPLYAMTGEDTPDAARRLGELGVSTCFEKPFDYDEVTRRVREELDAGPGVMDLIVDRFLGTGAAGRLS